MKDRELQSSGAIMEKALPTSKDDWNRQSLRYIGPRLYKTLKVNTSNLIWAWKKIGS